MQIQKLLILVATNFVFNHSCQAVTLESIATAVAQLGTTVRDELAADRAERANQFEAWKGEIAGRRQGRNFHENFLEHRKLMNDNQITIMSALERLCAVFASDPSIDDVRGKLNDGIKATQTLMAKQERQRLEIQQANQQDEKVDAETLRQQQQGKLVQNQENPGGY